MLFASQSLFLISVLGLLTPSSAKPAYRPRTGHEKHVEPTKSLRQFDPRKPPTIRAVPAPHHTRLSTHGPGGLSGVLKGVVAGIANEVPDISISGHILRSEPDVSPLSNANSNVLARGLVGSGAGLTSEGSPHDANALDTSSGVSVQAGVTALDPASLGLTGASRRPNAAGSITSPAVSGNAGSLDDPLATIGVSGGTSQSIAAAIIDLLISSAAPQGVEGSDGSLAAVTSFPTSGSLISLSIGGGSDASLLSVVDGTTASDPIVGSIDDNLFPAILALTGSSAPQNTASDTTIDSSDIHSHSEALGVANHSSHPASKSSASTRSFDNVGSSDSIVAVNVVAAGSSLDSADSPSNSEVINVQEDDP